MVPRLIQPFATILFCVATSIAAHAETCRNESFEGASYTVCSFDPSKDALAAHVLLARILAAMRSLGNTQAVASKMWAILQNATDQARAGRRIEPVCPYREIKCCNSTGNSPADNRNATTHNTATATRIAIS